MGGQVAPLGRLRAPERRGCQAGIRHAEVSSRLFLYKGQVLCTQPKDLDFERVTGLGFQALGCAAVDHRYNQVAGAAIQAN